MDGVVETLAGATERAARAFIGFVEALGRDTVAHDSWPDYCWRCDAQPATSDVGLCDGCRDDLRTEETVSL